MTNAQKISKGYSLIEEEIFNSIIDFENYSCYSDMKIEFSDNMDFYNEDDFDIPFNCSFKIAQKEIDFEIIVNIKTEDFKIYKYEDCYEGFASYNYTVSEFWAVLFHKAIDLS